MNIILHEKRDFADVIKLRTLKWGVYPGLSRWALDAITSVLIRGRFEYRKGEGSDDESRDRSDAATSQGMPAALERSWRRQGTESSLESPGGTG